jgi:hypothetical protein
MAKKLSFSYEELMGGAMQRSELERLADAGMLDIATFARIGHLGRFFERVGKACPNPDLQISEVLTEEELQQMWIETSDPGAEVVRCPLLQ